VGVRKRDKTKIQYCITSLIPVSRMKKEQPWWLLLTSPRGYMWELPLGQDIASGDFALPIVHLTHVLLPWVQRYGFYLK
jgi:hypothetical protein